MVNNTQFGNSARNKLLLLRVEEVELQFCSLKIDESCCENIHYSGAVVEIVNNSNELFKLEVIIL